MITRKERRAAKIRNSIIGKDFIVDRFENAILPGDLVIYAQPLYRSARPQIAVFDRVNPTGTIRVRALVPSWPSDDDTPFVTIDGKKFIAKSVTLTAIDRVLAYNPTFVPEAVLALLGWVDEP